MSGIEVAGVVLAVLPIVIKATTSCRDGVHETSKLRSSGHAKLKSSLFSSLYIELFFLNRFLRQLINDLPDLSQAMCEEVLKKVDTRDWKSGSKVAAALLGYLGPDDFELFETAISNTYYWIDAVFKTDCFRTQFGSRVRESLHNASKVDVEGNCLTNLLGRWTVLYTELEGFLRSVTRFQNRKWVHE